MIDVKVDVIEMWDIWMGLCLVKSIFCCSDYNLWIIYEFYCFKKVWCWFYYLLGKGCFWNWIWWIKYDLEKWNINVVILLLVKVN